MASVPDGRDGAMVLFGCRRNGRSRSSACGRSAGSTRRGLRTPRESVHSRPQGCALETLQPRGGPSQTRPVERRVIATEPAYRPSPRDCPQSLDAVVDARATHPIARRTRGEAGSNGVAAGERFRGPRPESVAEVLPRLRLGLVEIRIGVAIGWGNDALKQGADDIIQGFATQPLAFDVDERRG